MRLVTLLALLATGLSACAQTRASPPRMPERYTIERVKKADIGELVEGTIGIAAYIPSRLEINFDTLVEVLRKHRPSAKADLLRYMASSNPKRDSYKGIATRLYAELSKPNATESLIPLLRHSDTGVRETAAKVLAKGRDPSALDPLLDACLGRGGPAVLAATAALTAYPFEAAALKLRMALRNPALAGRAIDALGTFGKPAVPDLLVLVRSPSRSTSDTAAKWLIQLAEPRALDILLELADKRHPWPFADPLPAALAKIGPKALPGVLRLANDDRPEMRDWAVDALGQIGGKDAERRLIEALDDPDTLVRDRAARALAKWMPQRARSWADANAKHKAVENRYLARQVYEGLRDQSAAKSVVLPKNYAGGSRTSDISELLRFADYRPENRKSTWARLEKLCATGTPDERGTALRGLAKVAGADATPTLVIALQDSNSNVVFSALMALEQVGDRRALPALRKLKVSKFATPLLDRAIECIVNPSLRGRY